MTEKLFPVSAAEAVKRLLKRLFTEAKSKILACCTVKLDKGCEVGLHDHPDDDEVYYVISGKGLYNDGDGNWVEVCPGDSTLCGNGGWHAMKNVEDEPLVFLAVVVGY